MSKPEAIAIVGIGGIFPEAPTLDRFWENLSAGRCSAKEVPDGRWILSKEQAFDPRRAAARAEAQPVRRVPVEGAAQRAEQ